MDVPGQQLESPRTPPLQLIRKIELFHRLS
jgi:hypothetical protein